MYSTSVTPFPKDAVLGKVQFHIIVIYLWFGFVLLLITCHMITEINLILYLGISTAAFTTANYKASSGIKVYQKAYVSVISSLVVLVAIFNL